MKQAIIALGLSLVLALAATTASPRMGSGGPTGNYYKMSLDIVDYCEEASGDTIEVVNTGGSIENLLGMSSKKFTLGWVQEDVLQYYRKQDPTNVNENRMKVVLTAHMETIHILLPKGYSPKKGWADKLLSIGGGDEGISLDLLKGQKVGSWGGSLVSAKALNSFTGLGMLVTEIPAEKRATGGGLPLLLVGGQPYAPVQTLLDTGKYDLVGINADDIIGQAKFYAKTTANYSVGGKLVATPTFGVRALVIGKAFRSASRNETMSNLAGCVFESLIDLADDPDTSPNWASVYEAEEDGVAADWGYFTTN